MEKLSKKENELTLIPKAERYIEYMLDVIFKIPRVEKFSIGTEYKNSMYKMLENIMYLNKIETGRLEIINTKQEEYIKWLYEELKNGTYKHGGYRVFYITYPKPRKIEASRYIDRVVHRWMVDSFLNRYFVNQFISTSYACIKNRGMHKASMDVQKAMKHCTKIWNEYYILKMDIRKYFQNINKDILMNILRKKVKEEKLERLLEKIVYSNSGTKGIPIGNYTSQIFANIYLNEIDQYIKQKLKVKYYFRYMDDSVLFVNRISNIEYKFIINKKEKAIAKFKAQLLNKAEITLYAYDNLADYLYQKEPEKMAIRGELRESMQVEILEIHVLGDSFFK